jgi:hypothetical protein
MPMLDCAVVEVKQPKIKALIDTTELGLKHGSEFEKIAILGNQHWQKMAAKIGFWFVAGEINYFDNENAAITWLHN